MVACVGGGVQGWQGGSGGHARTGQQTRGWLAGASRGTDRGSGCFQVSTSGCVGVLALRTLLDQLRHERGVSCPWAAAVVRRVLPKHWVLPTGHQHHHLLLLLLLPGLPLLGAHLARLGVDGRCAAFKNKPLAAAVALPAPTALARG